MFQRYVINIYIRDTHGLKGEKQNIVNIYINNKYFFHLFSMFFTKFICENIEKNRKAGIYIYRFKITYL